MKKFTKNIEDFICEKCGCRVQGNGFTNHCPSCFYSKHVDNNPGDRACGCNGMMAPIGFFEKAGEMYVLHRCEKCSLEKKNKLCENDNRSSMLEIMKKLSETSNLNVLTANGFFKLNKNRK